MSPQGFPKKAFSALWAIRAMTTLSTEESLKSSEKMFPIRTEKAAEELKPEPAGRVLLITASKPPVFSPRSLKPAATPLTRDLDEPNSEGFTVSFLRFTSKGSYPPEEMLIKSVPLASVSA